MIERTSLVVASIFCSAFDGLANTGFSDPVPGEVFMPFSPFPQREKGRASPAFNYPHQLPVSGHRILVKDPWLQNSGRLEIVGSVLAAARIAHDLEAELGAFDDRAHARTLDCGDVDENVRTSIVGLDEAKATVCVKEFYGSSIHSDFLSIDIEFRHRQSTKRLSYIENEREDRSGRKTAPKQSSTSKFD
jgi:hypothetical protein